MKKTLALLATGAIVLIGVGSSAHAATGNDPTETTASVTGGGTITVGPNEEFTVFVTCDMGEDWRVLIDFYFEEQNGSGECVGEPEPTATTEVTATTDAIPGFRSPAGFVQVPPSPVASVVFTAPATAGTYVGEYELDYQYIESGTVGPLGFRSAPAIFVQAPEGDTFTVIVNQVAPTTPTTAAPTTLAPDPTTPGATTTIAATPGAPQTTAAPGVTTTAAISPALPVTGSADSGNVAMIAVVLLALGGGLIVATRYRRS